MTRKALTAAILIGFVFTARNAAAQAGAAWTEYGYFNINAGFGSKSGELSDSRTFTLYDEPATLAFTQPTDSGAFFDFSVGARAWRNFSFGIGYHQGKTDSDAHVTGSIPHPLFFNRNRSIDTTVSGLERQERAIHLQFGYMYIVNDKVRVHFLAGPSFFKLRQDVVSDISVAEQGSPFTSVNVTPTATESQSTGTGANIGVDVSYQLSPASSRTKVGVGGFARYAGCKTTKVLVAGGRELDSDVGGVQVGFGARLRW